ncbi:unnamed protein product [Calypogeia fissa]
MSKTTTHTVSGQTQAPSKAPQLPWTQQAIPSSMSYHSTLVCTPIISHFYIFFTFEVSPGYPLERGPACVVGKREDKLDNTDISRSGLDSMTRRPEDRGSQVRHFGITVWFVGRVGGTRIQANTDMLGLESGAGRSGRMRH